MMKLRFSIAQSRAIRLVGWTSMLMLCGLDYIIQNMVGNPVAIALGVVGIIGIILGNLKTKEKLDERDIKNQQEADALVLNIMGVVLVTSVFWAPEDLRIDPNWLFIGYVIISLLREIVVLFEERYGN